MSFFNWKTKDYEVVVLYRYDDFKHVDKNQFENICSYLTDLYQLNFTFMSFFTADFVKDYVYRIDDGLKKIEKIGWRNVITAAVYNSDFRKSSAEFSFTLSITNNPSRITLLIPRNKKFDIKAFLLTLQKAFKPDYGFNYFTAKGEWATAYGHTKYWKLSSMDGVSKLSKKDNERFGASHQQVRRGLFRDIFYVNILNFQHVCRKIEGTLMPDYIKEHNLGVIQLVYEDVYLWTLDKDQLEIARKLLISELTDNSLIA